MRSGLVGLLTVLAGLTGCGDRATNGTTIGFVEIRDRGGAWPYLLEVGDSVAMYSEALTSGWSGPVIKFVSIERPEPFTWHSSDSTVLGVDGLGVVEARGLGKASIWAVVDGFESNTWSLRVIPRGVARLQLEEVPGPANAGSRTFRVSALDAQGRSFDGIPFVGTLMLPDGGPPIRCAGGGDTFTPCEIVIDLSRVTAPVPLRVTMWIYGRDGDTEAEVIVQPIGGG